MLVRIHECCSQWLSKLRVEDALKINDSLHISTSHTRRQHIHKLAYILHSTSAVKAI